jgi:hypothetical protein
MHRVFLLLPLGTMKYFVLVFLLNVFLFVLNYQILRMPMQILVCVLMHLMQWWSLLVLRYFLLYFWFFHRFEFVFCVLLVWMLLWLLGLHLLLGHWLVFHCCLLSWFFWRCYFVFQILYFRLNISCCFSNLIPFLCLVS